MKIVSYNVNGIRAAMNKGLLDWIQAAQPDVLCVQETKALPEQVDIQAIEDIGYNVYMHSAEKKGYSGVAIISKEKPLQLTQGIGLDDFDREGRVIQADFENCSVISVYVPSGTNMDRLDFKMDFCHAFLNHINSIQKKNQKLVVCGDYNICHHAIDIHDPVRNANVSGFLPIEREWLSEFIDTAQMIDAFRYFVSEPHHYSWWSYRANARNNNKGWRIDYTMVSKPLEPYMQRAFILPDAKHSDHCPVGVELSF